MEIQHINVKLLLREPQALELERLVPIFHSWIQMQSREELLIDVADYRHVSDGPGVMLIGHEGNYSVDETDHRRGVRYSRKAPVEGSTRDRLAQAVRAAITACQALETHPDLQGKLRFGGQEIEIVLNDRLLTPNDPSTRQSLEPEFQFFFRTLFAGGEFTLTFSNGDPRRLFGVLAKSPRVFTTIELLQNLPA